jgi:hypothetical protein
MLRTIFFGFPGDVEAARYLYDLVAITFQTETAYFKSEGLYKNAIRARKLQAVMSFQMGLAQGINAKLHRLKADRDSRLKSSGSDLVLLKTSVIHEEFEKLGLCLRKKRTRASRRVMADAYEAGHSAGSKFEKAIGIKERSS